MKRAVWVTGVIPVLAATACGSVAGTAATSRHQPTVRPSTQASVTRSDSVAVAEPGKPVPASVVARLTAIADGVATEEGGHPVAWATAVVTTRAKALTSATPGDLVPNDENTVVYLITMKGSFIDYGYSGPPGSRPPVGRYVSLVMSAKNLDGTDYGISNVPPPVAPASLGPVTYLKVHPGARKPT
jgi:hypothetical protein